ncbi:NIPSNAP family protein [Paenibacillus cymbidii]|uniref:NIPSNAP family protein n=1 Tax=Paenibacillus cymbidii TaxID=1639034 RepID=UPI0010815E0E|nr:NIPSNAP family protein [Paenibacillus cymbidii]
MLYELRIYTMHEGRMEAIQERFTRHTFAIFARLGMKVTDFWIDADGKPKLYYVLAFADREERERQWERFRQDPAWLAAKRHSESEQNGGPIVAAYEVIFMNRAPFFHGCLRK